MGWRFFYLKHTYYNEDGSTQTADTRMYKDDDGYAVNRYLNYDNTYIDVQKDDGTGNPVMFDDEYFNPFSLVEEDDFELESLDNDTSEATITLTIKEEYATYFSYFLAGYQDIPLETITIDVSSGGIITGKTSFDEEYEEDGETIYAGGTYEFTIVDQETIETGRVVAYEMTDELLVLEQTLETLSNYNFEMRVDRTSTVQDISYETIEMSNVTLRTFDVEESNIANRTYTGYYEDEDGLHSVTSYGYLLEASGYPDSSTLASKRSNFGLSAALFDSVGDNTFVLKSGYESFVYYGAVDYMYNNSWFYYIDTGSYTIKILDNSVEISYTYTTSDYGNANEGKVEIELTNIGTTNIINLHLFHIPNLQVGIRWVVKLSTPCLNFMTINITT